MNLSIQQLADSINQKLPKFDVISLLRLLRYKHFKIENIWFASHKSLASENRVIESVSLKGKFAIIKINLGLLSVQSPLQRPLYEVIDDDIWHDDIYKRFFGFFDHFLVTNYLANIYPEINTHYFPDWHKTCQHYLALQNLDSTSTLYWLFSTLFPEFKIMFEQGTIDNQCKIEGLHLGPDRLCSQAILGDRLNIKLAAYHVHLTLEKREYRRKINWREAILKRLHTILFPVLDGIECRLKITFQQENDRNILQLQNDSSLGFESLYTVENTSSKICLHDGVIRQPVESHSQSINWGVSCQIQV